MTLFTVNGEDTTNKKTNVESFTNNKRVCHEKAQGTFDRQQKKKAVALNRMLNGG